MGHWARIRPNFDFWVTKSKSARSIAKFLQSLHSAPEVLNLLCLVIVAICILCLASLILVSRLFSLPRNLETRMGFTSCMALRMHEVTLHTWLRACAMPWYHPFSRLSMLNKHNTTLTRNTLRNNNNNKLRKIAWKSSWIRKIVHNKVTRQNKGFVWESTVSTRSFCNTPTN